MFTIISSSASYLVDVWMPHFGEKPYRGRRVRVVGGEFHLSLKGTSDKTYFMLLVTYWTSIVFRVWCPRHGHAKKTSVLHEFTLTPNVNKPRRFALCPAVAAREGGGKATLTLASFHDWIDNWELCRCSHEISGILYVMVTGNCELL